MPILLGVPDGLSWAVAGKEKDKTVVQARAPARIAFIAEGNGVAQTRIRGEVIGQKRIKAGRKTVAAVQ
jgi:hypothetical protein